MTVKALKAKLEKCPEDQMILLRVIDLDKNIAIQEVMTGVTLGYVSSDLDIEHLVLVALKERRG